MVKRALAHQAQTHGTLDLREDLVSLLIGGAAELKRGQTIAMRHGVGGTRIEALANHQDGFAMIRVAGTNPLNVRAERHVAGGLLPDEVEGVARTPHVLPAAGDAILAFDGVVVTFTPRLGPA
jgi:hypothetical protein